MKNINKQNLIALFLFIILAVIIFYQFFFKGLIPFPGNYMLAWYEPWKTDFSSNGSITIAHKPVADDVFRQLYPFKTLSSQLIKKLQLPLWNPYNGSGMPLLATMHVGFLTPFNLLFVFLPKHLAWGLYVAIQPILITFFTYLYCRKIGIKFTGSLFSSITFTLSGFVVARLLFGEYIYTLSILPLILYLIESFFDNQKTRKIWILPFTVAFMFFSGQPQIITYVLIFSICYYSCRLRNNKNIHPNSAFLIPILLVIGVGLAAIQLMPTLELFNQSGINPSSSKFIFDRFLLPIQHLITIFIPNYLGNQATYNYWGSGDYIETVASLGLIPSFFALLSIGRINTKMDVRKFYFTTIAITIILTLDWFGTRLLYSIPIPIISTGVPTRIFALTAFSISVLAGYGFDKWLCTNSFKEIKKQIIFFSAFVMIISCGTFVFYALKISCNNEFILNCRSIALRNTFLETFVFAIGLIFIISYTFNNKFKKNVPIGIIFLTIVIGIYNSTKFLPFSTKQTILSQNDLIKELQVIKDGRVFGLGEANIKTDFATYFGFYDPNYYDPLYNKRYGELIGFANNGIFSPSLPRSDVEIANQIKLDTGSLQRRERLLNLLSVKYFVYKAADIPKDADVLWKNKYWGIIKNQNALPRAYIVQNHEVVQEKENLLLQLFDPSFDIKQKVLLEESVLFSANRSESTFHLPRTSEYTENKVNLSVNLNSPSIVVLTDNFYPGWKVLVDGTESKLFRANYSFRAVMVSAGQHKVSFVYDPPVFKLGLLVSSLSIFLYCGIILFRKKICTYK